MLRVLVIALVLLVTALFLLPRPRNAVPATEVATVLPQHLALPDFALRDVAGRPFTKADLEGDYRLLFFGYTNCPDICPLTLQVLAAVDKEIAARAPDQRPQIVFVSVDPERDSADRMRAYLQNFNPEFVGVRGDEASLEPLVKVLGVSIHKVELDGQRYNVVHNGTIYMIGPDGALVAVFGGSEPNASAIVNDYLKIRRRPATAS